MARIAGVDLPGRKHLYISLQYIYGVGPKTAEEICESAIQSMSVLHWYTASCVLTLLFLMTLCSESFFVFCFLSIFDLLFYD